jgi:hypothetical protein
MLGVSMRKKAKTTMVKAVYVGKRRATNTSFFHCFMIGKKEILFSSIGGCAIGYRYWLEKTATGFICQRRPGLVSESYSYSDEQIIAWEKEQLKAEGEVYKNRDRNAMARNSKVLDAVKVLRPIFKGLRPFEHQALLEGILRNLRER